MLRWLPACPASGGSRLDAVGAMFITAALAALVFGMSDGEQHGFTSPRPLLAITLGLALSAAFVVTESRVRQPMLPLSLFRDDARSGSLLIILLLGAVVAGYVYFIALYLQQVLQLSALSTGLGPVPATLIVMVPSTALSRRLLPRLGVRTMLTVPLPLTATGQLWLSRISTDGSYLVDVLPGLLMTAAGMGLALPTASVAVNALVPDGLRGIAGGLLVTAQQTGAAIGLAVLATVAAACTRAPGAGLVDGFRTSFLVGAGIALVAAVLALTVIGRRSPR